MFLASTIAATCGTVGSHLGVYKGIARNASGALQLGSTTATSTIFQLEALGDSLFLRGNARGGTTDLIAAWPMSRVSSSAEALTCVGLLKGPIHLRRSMKWTLSGGIRASATITTNGASQPSDDFFGGSTVRLTLMKTNY